MLNNFGELNIPLKANLFTKCISVPKAAYGRIIGKNGASIKQLETNYEVEINLQQWNGILQVSGSNINAIDAVLMKIRNIITLKTNGRNDYQTVHTLPKPLIDQSPPNEPLIRAIYSPLLNNDFNGTVENVAGFETFIDCQTLNEHCEALIPSQSASFVAPVQQDIIIGVLSPSEVEHIRKAYDNVSVRLVFADNLENNSHLCHRMTNSILNSVWKFEQCFGNSPELFKEYQKYGLDKPTSILAQGWPVLLNGRDLIATLQISNDKTLPFIIPALIHAACRLTQLPCGAHKIVMVLVPTSKLAQQVHCEITQFSFRGLKS